MALHRTLIISAIVYTAECSQIFLLHVDESRGGYYGRRSKQSPFFSRDAVGPVFESITLSFA